VLKPLEIQWVQSYVTDDKVYCVYIAPNEELVREHANQAGLPADRISEVRSVIDPTTVEEYEKFSMPQRRR
jgi:cell division inhibitor SulA